ncbi:hypothetical protein BCU68_10845 [Vibrio sp. 10N.286.49.B3]|uniref:hypothetical protein n=1 Tax=Vibrio sp. 10N.286.49.B3 TaxID=1880855 RepID=UPI000C83BA7F|nr:hypothetical protein [Vibrio sp. 10N.286.49.B3]PMH45353.1 hypothetical protein BCU68_10845 [Vibrio sp. 10N.286.49.B3]
MDNVLPLENYTHLRKPNKNKRQITSEYRNAVMDLVALRASGIPNFYNEAEHIIRYINEEIFIDGFEVRNFNLEKRFIQEFNYSNSLI